MPSSGASSARHIAGADALGEVNDEEVRGSVDVVTMGRVDSRRRKAEAIQAQLEKIKPLSKAPAPVPAAALAADLAAMKRSGGIAAKTAGKVATDERTLDQFLEERKQRLDEGMYPSRETMVEFAAWLTRRRERVCLAQRVDSGPRLQGLVKKAIRNMLTVHRVIRACTKAMISK